MQLRVLVAVIAGLMLVVGISTLRQAPVDVLPEFAQPYVEIQNRISGALRGRSGTVDHGADGAGSSQRAAWLSSIRSDSVHGLSSVVLALSPAPI